MATKTETETQESLVKGFLASAEARLKELEPLVAEAAEIRQAVNAVTGANGDESSPAAPAPQGRPRQRRNRKGGKRADQFVKLVTDNPGITVADAAKQMKIQPNYLYRVAGELVEDGQVTKDGRGYVPAAS